MTTPRIYLAARYSRNAEMRDCARQLEELGYVVTSRWIHKHGGSPEESLGAEELTHSPEEGLPFALADLEDIEYADILILFTEENGGGKGGRHTEFGYALARRKRIIIVGPRENVFHTLPGIQWHPNWDHFISYARRVNGTSSPTRGTGPEDAADRPAVEGSPTVH
jgi:hypothetical protein